MKKTNAIIRQRHILKCMRWLCLLMWLAQSSLMRRCLNRNGWKIPQRIKLQSVSSSSKNYSANLVVTSDLIRASYRTAAQNANGARAGS